MHVEVQVTHKHITSGKMKNQRWCPISLAMRDAGLTYPLVRKTECEFYRKLSLKICSLPKEARKFIENFDKGREVKPLVFKLEMPPCK